MIVLAQVKFRAVLCLTLNLRFLFFSRADCAKIAKSDIYGFGLLASDNCSSSNCFCLYATETILIDTNKPFRISCSWHTISMTFHFMYSVARAESPMQLDSEKQNIAEYVIKWNVQKLNLTVGFLAWIACISDVVHWRRQSKAKINLHVCCIEFCHCQGQENQFRCLDVVKSLVSVLWSVSHLKMEIASLTPNNGKLTINQLTKSNWNCPQRRYTVSETKREQLVSPLAYTSRVPNYLPPSKRAMPTFQRVGDDRSIQLWDAIHRWSVIAHIFFRAREFLRRSIFFLFLRVSPVHLSSHQRLKCEWRANQRSYSYVWVRWQLNVFVHRIRRDRPWMVKMCGLSSSKP